MLDTGVGFVGAATSGLDHIDSEWLGANGVALAHCRGANAWAVVEYCLGAIANLRLAGRIETQRPSIGVVGAGAIGGRLARRMRELGHEVVVAIHHWLNSGGRGGNSPGARCRTPSIAISSACMCH